MYIHTKNAKTFASVWVLYLLKQIFKNCANWSHFKRFK